MAEILQVSYISYVRLSNDGQEKTIASPGYPQKSLIKLL